MKKLRSADAGLVYKSGYKAKAIRSLIQSDGVAGASERAQQLRGGSHAPGKAGDIVTYALCDVSRQTARGGEIATARPPPLRGPSPPRPLHVFPPRPLPVAPPSPPPLVAPPPRGPAPSSWPRPPRPPRVAPPSPPRPGFAADIHSRSVPEQSCNLQTPSGLTL